MIDNQDCTLKYVYENESDVLNYRNDNLQSIFKYDEENRRIIVCQPIIRHYLLSLIFV